MPRMDLLKTLFEKLGKRPQSTPASAHAPPQVRNRPACGCLAPQYKDDIWTELKFHTDQQDTECEAWKWLEALIEETHAKKRKEFFPAVEMGWEKWEQIVTLPRSIAKLKSVKSLCLYGSHLVRIPPEIGEMTNLAEFNPYTSYRLHWFPYEITRCRRLKSSCVSTRALYGNYKYRPPFPRLPPNPSATAQSGSLAAPNQNGGNPEQFSACSVCNRPFPSSLVHQVWISLRVATDVLPLLVNACSEECLKRLPTPADGYVDHPHKGGLDLKQPPLHHGPIR